MIQQGPEGVTVVFGGPVAQEDHARRAVLAALDLQQRLARHPTLCPPALEAGLALGIGIHSGLGIVGELGPVAHRQVTVVGAPVQGALRLQQQAAPGALLVSAATYDLVQGEVRGVPGAPVTLEGWPAPLRVYAVQGLVPRPAGAPRRPGRSGSPFVGRQHEVALLHDRLALVRTGMGQVLSVLGPPGIGKSRLLTAWRRQLASEQVTWYAGQCLPYGQTTPYLPVRDMVQQVCGLTAQDPLEVRTAAVRRALARLGGGAEEDIALLLQVLDLPVAPETLLRLSPEARQARTFTLLGHLLRQAAQQRPLVLVVEDVHWIDSMSAAWLTALVDRLAGLAVLLLLTQRPGYQPPWGAHAAVTQVTLPPLRAEDSQAIVAAVPGTAQFPAARRQQLVVHGAGNPLFVEELAWYAVEHDLSAVPVAVPETVHAVLAARIDRLPREEKLLLQTAAVIGYEIPLRVLQAIAELSDDALQRGLTHLQTAELLYETRLFPACVYTFKHALTQEVAYSGLLQERRRTLHVRIVEASETLYRDRLTDQIERLAHHAVRGEVWDKALAYCQQAGEKAMARSANREAVAYFEQALSALPHLPTPRETHEQAIDLRLALHYPLLMLGELERMLNHLRQAETLAESLSDQRRLGWVSIYMTYYCWCMGDLDRALAAGLRALTIATDLGDVALQVRTRRVLGCSYHAGGDYHRALDLFRRAMEGFADHHIPAHFRLTGLPSVGVNAWLLWCLADLGEFAEGMARGEAMGQVADGVNDPADRAEACFGTGILYLYKGDLPQAIARLERGLGHCQSDNLLVWFPLLAVALGHAYTLSGRVPEALPLLERGVKLDAAIGIMSGHMLSLTWLSEAHLRMERTDVALQIAGRALALANEHHERGNQAYALRLLGAIAAHGNPPDGAPAEAYYRQALALAEELSMRPLQAHCHLGLGMLYATTDQRELARTELSAAIDLYRAMDMTFWLPETEAALAQLDV